MKKKQLLVACLPAVITLLIIVMNVLTENKVSALYKNAVSALDARDYSAVDDSLSRIQEIAPEYVPQYALHAESYLRMSESNQQLAYQVLRDGIRATGSKYLISLADRLEQGDTSLMETQSSTGQGQSGLPQTSPEDSDFLQPSIPQQNSADVQYIPMNYDFIVRYPDSRMENDVQLTASDDSSAASWTWTSSNPAVASVDEQGVVHCGNKEGEAKITARNSRNEVAECWVCIIEPSIYSNDDTGADNAINYWYPESDYYYIPEGNLSLDMGNKGMDAAVAATETKSAMEFLPHNSVSGDGLIGTAELSYTPSNSAFSAEMVNENGFPIYQTEADSATGESAQQDTPDGGTVSLQLGWQSIYFSGEYRIPDHLRFNGAEFTPTSVDFSYVYNSDITSLYLPASVTDLNMDYSNPFSNYTQLETITVEDGNPAFKTENGALLTADGTELLAYPCAASATEFTIPDGVTTIAPYAFANNPNLTTLNIPASVTEFGYDALTNVSSLKSINLDSGNTAFQVVDGVLLNAAGTEILAATIADMPENYTISAQVTSVNEDIFRQNSKVKNLTVDASLSSLNLNDCTGLETLVINGSMGYLSCYSTSDGNLKDVILNGEAQSLTISGGSEDLTITLNGPVTSLYAADSPVTLVNPENVTTMLSLYLSDDTSSALSASLKSVTLNLGEQEIRDLQLLQPCTSLSSLSLSNGTVKDLSALSSLSLLNLELRSVKVQDFSPIWQCTQLSSLSITGNDDLTSVDGIQALQDLSAVELSNNSKLSDVSPLASCTDLVSIGLNNCDQISDVSALTSLPSLQRIALYGTAVPEETLRELESRGIYTY